MDQRALWDSSPLVQAQHSVFISAHIAKEDVLHCKAEHRCVPQQNVRWAAQTLAIDFITILETRIQGRGAPGLVSSETGFLA